MRRPSELAEVPFQIRLCRLCFLHLGQLQLNYCEAVKHFLALGFHDAESLRVFGCVACNDNHLLNLVTLLFKFFLYVESLSFEQFNLVVNLSIHVAYFKVEVHQALFENFVSISRGLFKAG